MTNYFNQLKISFTNLPLDSQLLKIKSHNKTCEDEYQL